MLITAVVVILGITIWKQPKSLLTTIWKALFIGIVGFLMSVAFIATVLLA